MVNHSLSADRRLRSRNRILPLSPSKSVDASGKQGIPSFSAPCFVFFRFSPFFFFSLILPLPLVCAVNGFVSKRARLGDSSAVRLLKAVLIRASQVYFIRDRFSLDDFFLRCFRLHKLISHGSFSLSLRPRGFFLLNPRPERKVFAERVSFSFDFLELPPLIFSRPESSFPLCHRSFLCFLNERDEAA